MLAVAVLALTACSSGSPDSASEDARSGSSATPVETWDLVVLSDSSGWGLADAWAEMIRRDEGVEVSVTDLAPFARMWRDILAEIVSLRDGRPTALRTRDIYDPVVPQHVAAGTAEACTAGSRTMTAIIRAETARVGGTFVAVHRAFNGPDGMADPRELGMFVDADHLSDKGGRAAGRAPPRGGVRGATGGVTARRLRR